MLSSLAQAVIEWDRHTLIAVNHALRSRPMDGAMLFTTDMGLGHVQVLAILAAAVAHAVLCGDLRSAAPARVWQAIARRKAWVTPLLLAFALGGISSTALKSISRERPAWYYQHQHQAGRDRDVTVDTVPGVDALRVRGFPSGHTTTTAAIAAAATLLFLRRRRGWLVVLCVWSITLLIGWSRMYLGSHWPLDVLGGLLLGALCGAASVRWYGRRACRPSAA